MTTMTPFQHVTPPLRLFYGPDSLQALGKELDRLGSQRAVVFCGRWAAGPMLESVRASMGDRCAAVFDGVVAHSPVNSVAAAAQLLKQAHADAAVALGGGSAIVTARAASILAAEGKVVRDLCTVTQADGSLKSPKLMAPKLPQIIIPTTPTTAMVKAGSAVFDPEAGERLAMFDPKTRAQSIFIEPAMLSSAPRALVTSASVNTYATVFEGLMSRTGNPLADGMLMHSARLLARHLPAPSTHDDSVVRGELVLAGILCGQGTDHTGAGVTTVIGHAIGAQHGVEHGLVNAVMLPHVLRFNAAHAKPGLAKVGAALGLHQTDDDVLLEALVHSVRSTFDALGLPKRLRDLGVSREALPAIARHSMGDWFLRGNPKRIENAAEISQLLELAW
jgi:alcohol dehydrogenase class IV